MKTEEDPIIMHNPDDSDEEWGLHMLLGFFTWSDDVIALPTDEPIIEDAPVELFLPPPEAPIAAVVAEPPGEAAPPAAEVQAEPVRLDPLPDTLRFQTDCRLQLVIDGPVILHHFHEMLRHGELSQCDLRLRLSSPNSINLAFYGVGRGNRCRSNVILKKQDLDWYYCYNISMINCALWANPQLLEEIPQLLLENQGGQLADLFKIEFYIPIFERSETCKRIEEIFEVRFWFYSAEGWIGKRFPTGKAWSIELAGPSDIYYIDHDEIVASALRKRQTRDMLAAKQRALDAAIPEKARLQYNTFCQFYLLIDGQTIRRHFGDIFHSNHWNQASYLDFVCGIDDLLFDWRDETLTVPTSELLFYWNEKVARVVVSIEPHRKLELLRRMGPNRSLCYQYDFKLEYCLHYNCSSELTFWFTKPDGSDDAYFVAEDNLPRFTVSIDRYFPEQDWHGLSSTKLERVPRIVASRAERMAAERKEREIESDAEIARALQVENRIEKRAPKQIELFPDPRPANQPGKSSGLQAIILPEGIDRESSSDATECRQCMERELNTVNLPCGCRFFCIACSHIYVTKRGNRDCPRCHLDLIEIKKTWI